LLPSDVDIRYLHWPRIEVFVYRRTLIEVCMAMNLLFHADRILCNPTMTVDRANILAKHNRNKAYSTVIQFQFCVEIQ
jgi:hypothetical protein